MAAAPVNPPSGDDVSAFTAFFEWARNWGWGVIGGFVAPASWHLSSRITKIEERLGQHSDKLADQVATNRELRDRVAGLADKDDIRDLKSDIRSMSLRVDQVLSNRQSSTN